MTPEAFLEGYERSVRALPSVLERWETLADGLRQHYRDEFEYLLVARASWIGRWPVGGAWPTPTQREHLAEADRLLRVVDGQRLLDCMGIRLEDLLQEPVRKTMTTDDLMKLRDVLDRTGPRFGHPTARPKTREERRAEIQRRMAEKKKPELVAPTPPPRYDEVFYEGTRALNADGVENTPNNQPYGRMKMSETKDENTTAKTTIESIVEAAERAGGPGILKQDNHESYAEARARWVYGHPAFEKAHAEVKGAKRLCALMERQYVLTVGILTQLYEETNPKIEPPVQMPQEGMTLADIAAEEERSAKGEAELIDRLRAAVAVYGISAKRGA